MYNRNQWLVDDTSKTKRSNERAMMAVRMAWAVVGILFCAEEDDDLNFVNDCLFFIVAFRPLCASVYRTSSSASSSSSSCSLLLLTIGV